MKRLFPLITFALISLNAQAGLIKWVDSEGKVHYSDMPPPDAKLETVRNISEKGPNETPTRYSPKSVAEREADLKKSRLANEESARKKSQENAQAEAKKDNCETSRQNARALEEGARIVTYEANGERSYLDDDARAQRLEEARKAISANCN